MILGISVNIQKLLTIIFEQMRDIRYTEINQELINKNREYSNTKTCKNDNADIINFHMPNFFPGTKNNC